MSILLVCSSLCPILQGFQGHACINIACKNVLSTILANVSSKCNLLDIGRYLDLAGFWVQDYKFGWSISCLKASAQPSKRLLPSVQHILHDLTNARQLAVVPVEVRIYRGAAVLKLTCHLNTSFAMLKTLKIAPGVIMVSNQSPQTLFIQ